MKLNLRGKKSERFSAMLKEQHGVDLAVMQKQDAEIQRDYKNAVGRYKAQFVNYIASRVNYVQFQYQDYTLAKIITELYLKDSVVASCIQTYQMHYPEPFKVVYNGDNLVEGQEVNQILNNPNPWMTESDLDRYMITYQLWTGNCYLLKIREDNGELAGLFPFSGLNVYPIPTYDKFVDHYNFLTAEGITSRFEMEDIVHLPWIAIDPIKPYMGISPIQLCSRDIQTDIILNELVGNYANNITVPGLIITPSGAGAENITEVSDQTAQDIKEEVKKRFGGTEAGEPAVLQDTGWVAQFLGMPLKDLDLETATKIPQTNICSNFKVDPEFIKVAAGLQSSTYDNQQTSKLNFFQGILTTLWVQNADKLSKGLQGEYGDNIKVQYDISKVGVLKEYRNNYLFRIYEVLHQTQVDYVGGLITRDMAINSTTLMLGIERREAEPLFPILPALGKVPKLTQQEPSQTHIDIEGNTV